MARPDWKRSLYSVTSLTFVLFVVIFTSKGIPFAQTDIEMDQPLPNNDLKYLALSRIVLAIAGGESLETAARLGLTEAVKYLDLAAGGLVLWDGSGEVFLKTVAAENDDDRQLLIDTEDSLLKILRQNHQLEVAFMQLGGDPPRSLFSMPLMNEKIQQKMRSARNEGIIELARAINHHNNNALQSFIGMGELIINKYDDLPPELKKYVTNIEKSAKTIKEVTRNSLRADNLPVTEYIDKTMMIDLYGEISLPTVIKPFGAFVGIKQGKEAPLYQHHQFLQSLATVLTLVAIGEKGSAQDIDSSE